MTTTPTILDTRREKERAKYVALAAKPGSTYGSTNHGKLAVPIIQKFKPRFVVDFGCGRNDLVRELRRLGIDGLGIDFAFPEADMVAPMQRVYDSGLRPVPKPVTLRSESYLAYVRKHPCCLCGASPSEAHHCCLLYTSPSPRD